MRFLIISLSTLLLAACANPSRDRRKTIDDAKTENMPEIKHTHPTKDPESPIMLGGDWFDDPHAIDFGDLPEIPSRHSIVSDVRDADGTRVNQHNYLAHFGNLFWAMWSDGRGDPRKPSGQHRDTVPGHDLEGQHVSFATSEDRVTWSAVMDLAGVPEPGFGWIARGFWIREGKLLVLVSRFVGPKSYTGLGLQLHALLQSPYADLRQDSHWPDDPP